MVNHPAGPRLKRLGSSADPVCGPGSSAFAETSGVLLALLVEQRDALGIRRLRDRLQIGVNILEIPGRQDRLRVRRHGAVGGADESREWVDRQGTRRGLGAGAPALSWHAVTLPAAVLDIGRLALLG